MEEQPQRDSRALATSLAPHLCESCEGRLSDISWFRTDWQRGGAATGTATWHLDDGSTKRVVVKLPVVQRELTWSRRLGSAEQSASATDSEAQSDDHSPDPVCPRLFASGDELGGYDLAWVVIEWIERGPLGAHWQENTIERMANAAARFYLLTSHFSIDREGQVEDWDSELRTAQRKVVENNLPLRQRWKAALRTLHQRIDPIVTEWCNRPIREWIHGDLHPANAMTRGDLASGAVTLIDLAEVRPGHWIEDAVYLERLLWTRPERIKPVKPVKAIAEARRAVGLGVNEDWPRLAMIRRALLAGTAPMFLKSEGSPRHLEACLDWLETALRELK